LPNDPSNGLLICLIAKKSINFKGQSYKNYRIYWKLALIRNYRQS